MVDLECGRSERRIDRAGRGKSREHHPSNRGRRGQGRPLFPCAFYQNLGRYLDWPAGSIRQFIRSRHGFGQHIGLRARNQGAPDVESLVRDRILTLGA